MPEFYTIPVRSANQMSAVNGHRRRSSVAMHGSLAGMKDVSPEELKELSHGVQVIDGSKEFTFVSVRSPSARISS